MKPFKLKTALEGAKVVTRHGQNVTEISHLKGVDSAYSVVGIVTGNLHTFTPKGSAAVSRDYDLFIVPVPVTKWANMYVDNKLGVFYDSKEEAINNRDSSRILDKTVKIEWEE